MDLLDEEIIGLFKALQKRNVKYIIVGGFATVLNGHTRLTLDVDIWIDDTLENRTNLKNALVDVGLDDLPQLLTIDFVPGWSSIKLPSGFELDIMSSLAGFPKEQFNTSYSLSNEAIIEGIPIRFFHVNQLIQSKKACNRLKDQLDVEELEKIKKESENENQKN